LVVKINETTGERSIYLGSYAEVAYTGAVVATPTPPGGCSVSERHAQPLSPMRGTFSAHAGTQPRQHPDTDQIAQV